MVKCCLVRVKYCWVRVNGKIPIILYCYTKICKNNLHLGNFYRQNIQDGKSFTEKTFEKWKFYRQNIWKWKFLHAKHLIGEIFTCKTFEG